MITHLQGDAEARGHVEGGVALAAETGGKGGAAAVGLARVAEGHGQQAGAGHGVALADAVGGGAAGGGCGDHAGDGGAREDAGAEDQITGLEAASAELAHGERGAEDAAAEACHRLELHGQGGGAEVGDGEPGAAVAGPGNGGDGGVAVGVAEQLIPLVSTSDLAGLGVDQTHLDDSELLVEQGVRVGLGGLEGADGHLGPHQEGTLLTSHLHREAAQIGDDVAGRSIKIRRIHIVPGGVCAALAGGGVAVADALIAVDGIHEGLEIGLAITAGEWDHRLGGFHPEHIGGLGGGIGDRGGVAGKREVEVVGVVV